MLLYQTYYCLDNRRLRRVRFVWAARLIRDRWEMALARPALPQRPQRRLAQGKNDTRHVRSCRGKAVLASNLLLLRLRLLFNRRK